MLRYAALVLTAVAATACGDATPPRPGTAATPADRSPTLSMARVRPGEPLTGAILSIDLTRGIERDLRLDDGAGDTALAASWSPDGRRVAVTRSLGMRDGDAFVNEATDIWIAASDGQGTRRLTRAEDGYAPVWTRDGTAIAFTHLIALMRRSPDVPPTSTSAIWLVPAAGGRETRLTNPPDGSFDLAGAVSPDGTTLAFTRCETGRPYPAGPAPTSCAVLLIGIDGSGERTLATRAQDPNWTPEGSAMVYSSDRDESGVMITGSDESGFTFDLYKVDAAGGAPVNLTRTRRRSETQPRISPGGELLAFTARDDDNYDQRVFIANADGTCRHQLKPDTATDTASWYSDPTWRPGSAGREQRRTCN